jgi:RND family efflux transporter MFP subunit
LTAAQNGTLDAQRKAIQSQVEAARQKLAADRSHLEQLVAGPQPEDVQAAQDAVDQAAAQLALVAQPSAQSDIAAQQALVEQAHQQLLKAQQPYTSDDIDQQAHAVAQAEAALRARQQPYTDQDFATAQAQVDQAVAALQQAQLALDQTRILAPVDGIVFERDVNPGALVGPQSPIVTLIPPALELDTTVDETSLASIQVGQSVDIRAAAYPNQAFTGTVSAVAPAVDSKTRTATVRVELNDPEHQLKPGMQAMVSIAVMTPDALVVPRDAVTDSLVPGSEATVVTLDNNQVERTSIRLGQVGNQMVEVTSGLAEGQLVAISNLSTLKNGDAVVAVRPTTR